MGGAPAQVGGRHRARRRDATANVVLAVLGAGDWSLGARLGVCGVLDGAWTLVVHQCTKSLRVRVLLVPVFLPRFSANVRECSGDVGRLRPRVGVAFQASSFVCLHNKLVHFQRLAVPTAQRSTSSGAAIDGDSRAVQKFARDDAAASRRGNDTVMHWLAGRGYRARRPSHRSHCPSAAARWSLRQLQLSR